MKNTQPRKPRAARLKSEDCRIPEDSTDLQLAKTLSKLSITEIKYSDLLSKIHKFISETSTFLDPILHTLPQKDQERLQSDIYYFLGINDSLYTTQLFNNFRQDVLEKLNFKDFSKETFKLYLLNKIQDLYLGVGAKDNNQYKKKILINDDKRELTPVRNMRRSISPCEKSMVTIHKENTELKSNLSEIIKQRDLLKAWKENVIRFPNLEVEAQKIIKDCKEESELFAMKNNCNLSKLTYIVNAVTKFLKSTSKVQKGIREKEGYLSWNFYEDERSKLEIRLKEVLESTDINWKPPPSSPLRTFESECKFLKTPELSSKKDLRRKSRDLQSNLNEKINSRLIEEITKQYTEKIETLNNQITKLETNNRKLKNKYYIVKKEMKQVKTTENQKKIEIFETFFNQKSTSSMIIKKIIEKNFSAFITNCESTFKHLFNSIEEKNIQISKFKSSLVRSLQGNLDSIHLLRVSTDEEKVKQSEIHKAQVLSLKSALAQHKDHTEKKMSDLEENLLNAEMSNKKMMITIKTLETEISILTKEKNNFVDSEKTLKTQNEVINQLALEKDALGEKVRSLQKYEALAQQFKFQKELLENEYSVLVSEGNEKVKRLMESDKRKSEVIDEMEVNIQGLRMENQQLVKALGEIQGRIEGYGKEDFDEGSMIGDPTGVKEDEQDQLISEFISQKVKNSKGFLESGDLSFDNLPQIVMPDEMKHCDKANLNQSMPIMLKDSNNSQNLTLSSTLPNQSVLKSTTSSPGLTTSANLISQNLPISLASHSNLTSSPILLQDPSVKLESSKKELSVNSQKSELLKGLAQNLQKDLPNPYSITDLKPKNVQNLEEKEAKTLNVKDLKQSQQNLKENSPKCLKNNELELQKISEFSLYGQGNEKSEDNVNLECSEKSEDKGKPEDNKKNEGRVELEGNLKSESELKPKGNKKREGNAKPESNVKLEGSIKPEGSAKAEGNITSEDKGKPKGNKKSEGNKKCEDNASPEGSKAEVTQQKTSDLVPGWDKSSEGGLDVEGLKRNLEMLRAELLCAKKQAIFVQVEKESVETELKQVREHYKNFESFLKYRILQLETGEIYMNRVDLSKYYCY